MQLVFNFLVSFLLCLFGSFFEGKCVAGSCGGDGGGGERGGVGFEVQISSLKGHTTLYDDADKCSHWAGILRERYGPDHTPAVSIVGTHQREHCQHTSA